MIDHIILYILSACYACYSNRIVLNPPEYFGAEGKSTIVEECDLTQNKIGADYHKFLFPVSSGGGVRIPVFVEDNDVFDFRTSRVTTTAIPDTASSPIIH